MTERELAAIMQGIAPVLRDLVTKALAERRDIELITRVQALEDRPAPKDGANGADGARGLHGDAGQAGAMGPAGERGVEGPQGRDGRDGLAGQPGAEGPRGESGADGLHGTNGRDGALDGLKAVFDGERMLTLCFKNGDPIEGGVLHLPIPVYRDVYVEGKTYDTADLVTWGGSTWLCRTATMTKPGDGSKAWTLIVKRGRDGRDGKDAEPVAPVVKLR